jgi:hypothetical protein
MRPTHSSGLGSCFEKSMKGSGTEKRANNISVLIGGLRQRVEAQYGQEINLAMAKFVNKTSCYDEGREPVFKSGWKGSKTGVAVPYLKATPILKAVDRYLVAWEH